MAKIRRIQIRRWKYKGFGYYEPVSAYDDDGYYSKHKARKAYEKQENERLERSKENYYRDVGRIANSLEEIFSLMKRKDERSEPPKEEKT